MTTKWRYAPMEGVFDMVVEVVIQRAIEYADASGRCEKFGPTGRRSRLSPPSIGSAAWCRTLSGPPEPTRRSPRQSQILRPEPGRPSSGQSLSILSITSSDMRILVPHARLVSGGHLLVASRPILEPRLSSGEAKSR
jgi:hypothetical protein